MSSYFGNLKSTSKPVCLNVGVPGVPCVPHAENPHGSRDNGRSMVEHLRKCPVFQGVPPKSGTPSGTPGTPTGTPEKREAQQQNTIDISMLSTRGTPEHLEHRKINESEANTKNEFQVFGNAPDTGADHAEDRSAEDAYAELLTLARRGLAFIDYGDWLRPRLRGRADAFRVQGLWGEALPILRKLHEQDRLAELRRVSGMSVQVFLPQEDDPQDEPGPGRSRIPATAKRSYRAAVAWLRPRLPELLDVGWTAKRLFGIGKHRWGCACCFGIAWAWPGLRPGWTPELTPEGIRWRIEEPGRVVYQMSRPAAGGGR